MKYDKTEAMLEGIAIGIEMAIGAAYCAFDQCHQGKGATEIDELLAKRLGVELDPDWCYEPVSDENTGATCHDVWWPSVVEKAVSDSMMEEMFKLRRGMGLAESCRSHGLRLADDADKAFREEARRKSLARRRKVTK